MDLPHMPEDYAGVISECVMVASEYYGVPDLLIESILYVEGGVPGKVTKNKGEKISYDIGPMQINNLWLSDIREKYGVTEDELKNDPCVNIDIGTWILRKYIDMFDGDVTKGVAAYNAGPRGHNSKTGRRYASKVIKRWNRLWKKRGS